MSEQPLHDWLRPRLEKLIHEAESAGYGRVPTIAIIADLMMDSSFNEAPVTREPASPPVVIDPSPIGPDFTGPSVGQTDWIKPYGSP
jgi:hypothetical protein